MQYEVTRERPQRVRVMLSKPLYINLERQVDMTKEVALGPVWIRVEDLVGLLSCSI